MIGGVSDILTDRMARAKVDGRDDPQVLKLAASEFESLLLSELLKSMRGTGSEGWLGSGEDQAGSTMVEMAEQQVAQAIASGGGLGLSKLIVQGLETPADKRSG